MTQAKDKLPMADAACSFGEIQMQSGRGEALSMEQMDSCSNGLPRKGPIWQTLKSLAAARPSRDNPPPDARVIGSAGPTDDCCAVVMEFLSLDFSILTDSPITSESIRSFVGDRTTIRVCPDEVPHLNAVAAF